MWDTTAKYGGTCSALATLKNQHFLCERQRVLLPIVIITMGGKESLDRTLAPDISPRAAHTFILLILEKNYKEK